jgi:hypothetical protein
VTPDELSSEVLDALGIDPANVTSAAIRFRVGHWPHVTVERAVVDADAPDRIRRTVNRLSVRPIDDDGRM